jgi:hypothetical protein
MIPRRPSVILSTLMSLGWRKAAAVVALNAVVSIVLLEGILVLFVHAPSVTAATPAPVRRLAQQIYRHFNRTLIQFDPACARYDPGVTYTLGPGSCRFANVEFSTTYQINSAGLRDSESALSAPEIIVIGDSHAMGWGVEQDETLAAVLAARSGKKVLNASVSSYGTARELMMLDRLDTSRLRLLVIQYADNDVVENLAFREHGGKLPITSKEDYDRIVAHYQNQRSYYPGKYLYRLVMKVLRLEEPEPDQLKMVGLPPSEEAALFLHTLEHGTRTPLENVQVIVFAVHQDAEIARAFTMALAQESRKPGHPPYVANLIVLNSAALLAFEDFYTLDDHMRPSGHRAIGERLGTLIKENGL